MARLLDKLQWRPFQVYLSHYRSAEIDISSIAVAYYLILTVFPLIVIAANVFPYLNIDTTDLLKFMNEHLPKHFMHLQLMLFRISSPHLLDGCWEWPL